MEETIRYINEHIGDEKSKKIFSNRLMYSITQDKKYLCEVIQTSKIYHDLLKLMKSDTNKKIIFGCGVLGKLFYDLYGEKVNFECFVDSNHYDYLYNGLVVNDTYKFFSEYKQQSIYICSWAANLEIIDILQKFGVKETNIYNVTEIIQKNWKTNQYFDFELMKINQTSEEVFVDGGCYDGNSSKEFIRWCGNEYKHIYAYEPDIQNYNKCVKLLNQIAKDKHTIFNKGLWEKNDNLNFIMGNNAGGRIDDSAKDRIEVTSIDESINDNVTFIKLDVEGSEYLTLIGAKKTIQKYRPKLAISVYHKPEDIYEIPKLILDMNPYYKLFFRHYSLNEWETVLYAIDMR